MTMTAQKETYVAIIGDLVGSRKIEDRQKLQRQLLDSLSDINNKFKDSLHSGLIVTTGDEFQGLAKDLKTAYNLTIEIKHRLFPYRARFGIGRGTLDVFPENKEFAIGFDGEAFWRAREAIQESEKSRVSVVFRTGEKFDDILKSIQSGIDWIVNNRTEKQAKATTLYQSGLNQKRIAQQMNTKQPGISRILKEGGCFAEINLKEGFIRIIDNYSDITY